MSGVNEFSLPDIERLLRAATAGDLGASLTHESLVRARLDALEPSLKHLLGSDIATVLLVLDAVREERMRPPSTRVSLVWTGPETRGGGARDTAVVVRELFASARRHVLIAGYSFERGEEILAPLHEVMREHGVIAEMFVHLREATDVPTDPEMYLRARGSAWRTAYWPFGDPLPTLFVDPRAAVPKSHASLHAKCIVVDGERALVGSANFTDRGHTRNIEAGVLVVGARFAEELARQFHDAVGAGLFVEV